MQPQRETQPNPLPYIFYNHVSKKWEEYGGRISEMTYAQAAEYVPQKIKEIERLKKRVNSGELPGVALLTILSDSDTYPE